MPYSFPALISRPVAFDTEDAYAVPVIVRCDVTRDGAVWFRDAKVSSDVRADDGTIAYHRGEVIGENSYTARNFAELNRDYLKNCQWDAADEVQAFPDYDVAA